MQEAVTCISAQGEKLEIEKPKNVDMTVDAKTGKDMTATPIEIKGVKVEWKLKDSDAHKQFNSVVRLHKKFKQKYISCKCCGIRNAS